MAERGTDPIEEAARAHEAIWLPQDDLDYLHDGEYTTNPLALALVRNLLDAYNAARGEGSGLLDRAEKPEAALRDVTAEEPETLAKLIADAMERWDLDDCDDRVYEDDWELSTWIAFDVARSLRSAVLAGGDS